MLIRKKANFNVIKIQSVKYANYVGIQIRIVGRHRWVEYAAKGRYNASQVPAEWHGWLHFVTDYTGDQVSQNTYTKHTCII